MDLTLNSGRLVFNSATCTWKSGTWKMIIRCGGKNSLNLNRTSKCRKQRWCSEYWCKTESCSCSNEFSPAAWHRKQRNTCSTCGAHLNTLPFVCCSLPDLELHQMNILNAFLSGRVKEETLIKVLKGVQCTDKKHTNYEFSEALYGSKTESRK